MMIFHNLIEDTNGSVPVLAEHGLSFLAETARHRYLFDTGASEKTWDNARTLGLSVTDVDAVILSHGHYDHTGGMMPLAERGYRGPVYIRDNAAKAYYNLRDYEKYIGIDSRIMELPGLIATPEDTVTKVNEELSIYSGVRGTRLRPSGNRILFEKIGSHFQPDEFTHEQFSVLETEGKRVLISGCAHKGILNILDRFRELYGGNPDAVISGFHMMKQEAYDEEDLRTIRQVAEELAGMKTVFYTGHCTSIAGYEVMKPILGERLVYVHSGERIEL